MPATRANQKINTITQTCSYITEQMQTPVSIDINKFMESFSIKAEDGGDIRPPSWIEGEGDSITFSTNPNPPSGSLIPSRKPFTITSLNLF